MACEAKGSTKKCEANTPQCHSVLWTGALWLRPNTWPMSTAFCFRYIKGHRSRTLYHVQQENGLRNSENQTYSILKYGCWMMFYVEVFQAHHPLSMLIRFFPSIGTAKRRAESSDLNLQLRDLRDWSKYENDPMWQHCFGQNKTNLQDHPKSCSVAGVLPHLSYVVSCLGVTLYQLPSLDPPQRLVWWNSFQSTKRSTTLSLTTHSWCVPSMVWWTKEGILCWWFSFETEEVIEFWIWLISFENQTWQDGLVGFCKERTLLQWHLGNQSSSDRQCSIFVHPREESIHTWQLSLVVDLPLWKIWVRQLGWWHSQLNGKS